MLISIRIDGFPVPIMIDEKQTISNWPVVKAMLGQKVDDIKEVIKQNQIAKLKSESAVPASDAITVQDLGSGESLRDTSPMTMDDPMGSLTGLTIVTKSENLLDWAVPLPWDF